MTKKPKRPMQRASSRKRASPKFRTTFGRNVHTYRVLRGMTQVDLSKRSNIDRFALSKMECGSSNVTLGMLEALAKALACTEADLLRRPGARRP